MRKIKKCLTCDSTTSRTWCWSCSQKYKKKKGPWSEETRRNAKPNTSTFKKGQIPWNKGKKYEQISDSRHFAWKGDDVGYIALHTWVARKLGKPNLCEDCGTTVAKKFEWANISGEYKRDLTDWKRLCTKCHHKLDKIAQRGWATKKARMVKCVSI